MSTTPTDPPAASPIRVVLADDQALLRAGFQMVIDSQPDLEVVGQAGTGAEAVATTRHLSPDVVLMDVRMPGGDGITATREILGGGGAGSGAAGCAGGGAGAAVGAAGPKIIVLTTFDTDEYAFQALQAGASGFLLKDTRPEALLDAIRTVVDGGAVVAPSTTRRLLDSMVARGWQVSAGAGSAAAGQPGAQPGVGVSAGTEAAATSPVMPELTAAQRAAIAQLTPREHEVLELMATGASNAEIADSLVLSVPTVKTHVGRILTKLGARDRVQAVVFAYQAGLAGVQ